MRSNILGFISLLVLSVTGAIGKDVSVDVSVIAGNDTAAVYPIDLGNGLVKYIFTPMDAAEGRFSHIRDNDITVPVDGSFKTKGLIVFKRNDVELLKVENPDYSSLNRNGDKTLYYTKQQNQWKNIERGEYLDLLHSINLAPIALNLTAPNSLIRTIKKPNGRIIFKPAHNHVFVTRVHALQHHIWPDKEEKGNLYKRGVYQNKNGKETFTIKFKDINGDYKNAHWEFGKGGWIRLKDEDAPVKQCNGSNIYLRTEDGEYQKCSMGNKTPALDVLSGPTFLESEAEEVPSRFQFYPRGNTANYGVYPKSGMYPHGTMEELKAYHKRRGTWDQNDGRSKRVQSPMKEDDVMRTRDMNHKKVVNELEDYHRRRGTWAGDNNADETNSRPPMNRRNEEFGSTVKRHNGTIDDLKNHKGRDTWDQNVGRSKRVQSPMKEDDVIRTRNMNHKKVVNELVDYHKKRGTWAGKGDDDDTYSGPPRRRPMRQKAFWRARQ